MAERVERPAGPENAPHGGSGVADGPDALGGANEIRHPDGSMARASTADGHLEASDVEHAPLVDGTDPLSDDAIERRRPAAAPVTPQLIVFSLLALFFAYFFISDVVNGSWGKAALGAAVLAICGVAIAREARRKG